MSETRTANRVLAMNTISFAICFAAWTLYGVLITFLVDHGSLHLDKAQIGWLIGTPVLTGSILRFPVGLLADRFGGKPVYIGVMVFSAIAMFFTSYASTFYEFIGCGLAFGVSGASFAVGVAYTSVWFPKSRQGAALGMFGMGNLGTAITAMGAPKLLDSLTLHGVHVEAWRNLPKIYAGVLLATAVLFALTTVPKRTDGPQKTLAKMLEPLGNIRVWRFGFYYFVLFGGFVAVSQWLIPYYVTVYGMTLAGAGMMATIYSLPASVTRAIGGFIADKIGARTTLYVVFSCLAVVFLLVVAPKMEIVSTGEGVMADRAGVVTSVSADSISVSGTSYKLAPRPAQASPGDDQLIWPRFSSWQDPSVHVGDKVAKKQIIASGTTHVFFQANRGVFTALLLTAAVLMGVGMAAVYKHIPEYFPNEVGVVGGLIGVLGGLGGFVLPILFGTMLKGSGLWTSCWLFMAAISIAAMVWMHVAILRMGHAQQKLESEKQNRHVHGAVVQGATING